jgi:LysM repeat protein
MKNHLTEKNKATLILLSAAASALLCVPGWAQNFPITAENRNVANEVAQKGIALVDLAPNAPDSYTVKSGDTLWSISSLFLKTPWRWPELWGMNLNEIKNPHLIYPGQRLVLERRNGVATLRLEGTPAPVTETRVDNGTTVRISPRTRFESMAESALATLRSSDIEPFLAEPIVVDESEFMSAARIVSAQDSRVLITRGDRAYARGTESAPLVDDQKTEKQYRVFRTATPLKDPGTGEVLGFEGIYVGKASLVRGETTSKVEENGKISTVLVPATIDIVVAKEEMRVGDRLFPEPPREFRSYTPRAPDIKFTGRVVSVYGSAVANAAQNQVVAINRGTRDGVESGHVLAILQDGARVIDKQDEARPLLKLPDERNGLMMVFRTFERVSYALVLETNTGVRVGDRLVSPR